MTMPLKGSRDPFIVAMLQATGIALFTTLTVLGCSRPSRDPRDPADIDRTIARSTDTLIVVGRNVRVSEPDSMINEYEMLAAADPANPSNLLACTMGMDPSQNARVVYIYS